MKLRLVLAPALLALVFAATGPLSAPAQTPVPGAPGITESVATIMARQAKLANRPAPAPHPVSQRFLVSSGKIPQNPNSPQSASWPPATAGTRPVSPPGPFTPQQVGTSFLGAQLSDTPGYVPPDSMGDVGPSQIVVIVNGLIRTYTRNGVADGALNANTDTFFTSVLGGSSTSDPRVRFDRLSGRWFVTMITVNTPNSVLLAVSSGPTITSSSSFTFFSFQADPSNFGDYDTLGVDAHALYVGVNVFGRKRFNNTTEFVINKSNLLTGTLTVTTFSGLISGGTGPYTPQGVNNDDPASTEGYIIGVDFGATGTLVLLRVSDPGGTPTLSTNILITVPATDSPISVPAQSSSLNLDALDTRLFATRMHNGSLWTAHNIQVDNTGTANTSGGRDGSRWYQINNLSTTPTLVQSGTLFDSSTTSSPRNFWIPSCAMSGQGHMAIGCSVAGTTEYADIATAGRLAGDPLGTLQAPTTAVTSSSTYNIGTQNGVYRWGDFSVMTVDPNDDMTFWTFQEYCNAGNSWGVQVIKLLAPPPVIPAACLPQNVTQGTTVNVTLTGTATNGWGFFDPGPGFPNHIGASTSGSGITLNGVTYNNPTNLTLNLTIAGNAGLGGRFITVTNPDGQIATSLSTILAVIAGSNSNLPPTLAAISNRTMAVGMTLTITNTASDSDGDQLTFSLGAGAATNAVINPTSGVFSWAPTQVQIGTNNFKVIVTDSGSPPLSATQTFLVTVVHSNIPPTLAAVSNRTMAVGMTLMITNAASDPDGDQLTFGLGIGAATNATINPTNGIFSWAPTQAQIGTNNFSVFVTDNGLPPLSATQTFLVTVVHSNSPPTLAAISNRTMLVGTTLTITNAASDSDGDQLTFSLGAGAATNATINPTNGLFSWTPNLAQIGSNGFTVVVTDNGLPPLSASQSFAVLVQSNTPPTLAPIPNQQVYALSTLTFTASANDPDAPPETLTFTLDPGAPAGAGIGPTNGLFTWTPALSQIGSNAITVRVTDNGTPNLSDARVFTANVLPGPTFHSITVVSNATLLTWNSISGATYQVQFKANLRDSNWANLLPTVMAVGASTSATNAATNPAAFYRLQVVP